MTRAVRMYSALVQESHRALVTVVDGRMNLGSIAIFGRVDGLESSRRAVCVSDYLSASERTHPIIQLR